MDCLDKYQLEALDHIKNGHNIYIGGIAGSGKSFLIKYIYDEFKCNNKIYITSTTGISAFNINGITIHSFLGIKSGDNPINFLLKSIKKNKERLSTILECQMLIIDEVSMLTSSLFSKINELLQLLRNNDLFFGGIQLILLGDFLQLESINGEMLIHNDDFNNLFKKVILQNNYRQKNDKQFIDLLSRLRINNLNNNDLLLLKSINYSTNNIDFNNNITLYSTNNEVNYHNQKYFDLNNNKPYTFQAIYKGNSLFKTDILKQFIDKNLNTIILKKDLKIMLIRNINVDIGLYNGSIGTIIDFDHITNYPIIKFDNGITHKISPVKWEYESNGFNCSVTQLPLILSYALTIHKTQGLTLSSAIVDLSRCFCNHQIYVAISRVQSLFGLKLINFNPKKIKINKNASDFYTNLQLLT